MSRPVGAVPSRVDGSIARAAFDEALEVLRASPLSDLRTRVPYDYRPPTRSAASPRPAAAGSVVAAGAVAGDAVAGDGPIGDALAALRVGEVSATTLAQQALDAIDARNDELVAMVAVDADAVLAEAAARDRDAASRAPLGPLHGIPLSIKDVIDVAGLPTRCANVDYLGEPTADAVAVARLRDAGAVIIGKAATHEFALGVASPQTRNPWDLTRIPGGSSGGSAAAVMSGMGMGSLGTDTRASLRVPAALSGAVGFKPTYGRIPTDGVVSLAWTMDHVGPLARTVSDAARLLDVLLDDGRHLAGVTATADGLRVGVAPAAFAGAPPELAAVVHAAIERLGADGADVGTSELPSAADLELANAAGLVVSRVEAATFHRGLELDPDGYWEEVGDQLRSAATLSGIDYLDAQRCRGELAQRLLSAFDAHDVLVMPTVPVVAPRVDEFAEYLMVLSRNAIPWSFVGFPAISVPCGTVDGLPVGLQIVAPPDREDLLVAVGRAVEQSA